MPARVAATTVGRTVVAQYFALILHLHSKCASEGWYFDNKIWPQRRLGQGRQQAAGRFLASEAITDDASDASDAGDAGDAGDAITAAAVFVASLIATFISAAGFITEFSILAIMVLLQ
ncbi:hypothetical protein MY4824_001113 [Beauveria thailandica]